MELKVGMYVRTSLGIAKYCGLGKEALDIECREKTNFHYDDQYLFDNQIFDVEHDYGDTLSYNEFLIINEVFLISEPSFDVIDVIEKGDYVNGILIDSIYKFEDGTISLNNEPINFCEIETIVTKEQFETIEYKVGEEK